MIDIGGPAMLRAAAKNFAARARPSAGPRTTSACSTELRASGELSLETRRALAARGVRDDRRVRGGDRDAGSPTREAFPETLVARVREGARPRVRREPAPARRLLRRARRPHATCSLASSSSTARSSRSTTSTTSPRARCSLREFDAAGVRDRQAREPVRRRGRGDDRGGVRQGARVRPGLGVRRGRRAQRAVERGARGEARGAVRRGALRARLRRRGARRRCARSRTRGSSTTASGARSTPGERDYKRVLGGMLVQDRDSSIETARRWNVVGGDADRGAVGRPRSSRGASCKHVASNAIVIAKDLQTIGIGAGQMSRVDAVRIAVEKAREHGHDLEGAALASDAFFPFADGPRRRARGAAWRDRPARRLEPRRRSGRGRRAGGRRQWSSRAAGTSDTRGREQAGCRGTHRNKWLILAVRRCAAFFMTILDVAIVNVAMPWIGRGCTLAELDVPWIVTASAIAFGGFLLLGGRMADLLGRRRVFTAGLVVFTLASLTCGLRGHERTDRFPRSTGPRRGDHLAGGALDRDDDVQGGRGPQQGTRHVGRARRDRARQ